MNSFGRLFRINIFGESHGEYVGIVVDGVPPGIPLIASEFENDLSRRRSGQPGTTGRKEPDVPLLQSGVYNGFSTGAPIIILFKNQAQHPDDYDSFRNIPRPSHADFTAQMKYGKYTDPRGGGHFSGRLTLPLVAAGVIAKKLIHPIEIESQILEIGGEKEYLNPLNQAIEQGDSLGGIVECRIKNVPAGLGEPFFDSIESVISHLVFSIPGIKGIEFGSGFEAAKMKGSIHNDCFETIEGKTFTNHSGGINGGISNGNEIVFRVAVKPTSSISIPQKTINLETKHLEALQIKGRHDASIALRIPVCLEAVAAIALADLYLQH